MTNLEQPDWQDPLSQREIEILQLIAAGLSNRQIAQQLFLSLETIRWYTKRIYSKLQVGNRTQAAALAQHMGIIQPASQTTAHPFMSGLPKHNLPAQVTAFVGRVTELQDLSQLLSQKNNRLVTILAPGGWGKSRLAIQAAKAFLPDFPDGVFFIPLENLNDPGQIATAVVEALKLQLASPQSEQQLLQYLRDKKMLLVLDGYEKLVSEYHLVPNLLMNAPDLKLLVTSRLRLSLQGELIYKLSGLEIPQAETPDQVVRKSSAVKLFIQSASLVRPNVEIRPDDLPHLVRICRLVGGMPLGILLAAAWIELLSPQEIANEIAHDLDFLKTEKHDVPERQQSIRVIFDHSLQLLQPADRPGFIKLSVFRGSFTRNAAAVVAGVKVAQLALFVGKSLLQYDPITKRYQLHELLRQYALEKLIQNDQLAPTLDLHITYYADLLAQLEQDFRGPGQTEALDHIQADFENIRFAWNRAVDQKNAVWIDRALEGIYWFCNLRGRVPDGQELFEKARAQFVPETPSEWQSFHRRLLLRFDAAGEAYQHQLEQALAQISPAEPGAELAFLRWAHGVNGYVMGDFSRAVTSLEKSLALYRQINDSFYMIEVLHLLWLCTKFLGAAAAARQYYEQALQLGRETGNKAAVARAVAAGGAFEFLAGGYSQAEIWTHEALELRREISDQAGEAMSLAMLGWVASASGNLEQGKRLAQSGQEIAASVHHLNSKMTALNVLGWIACLENDFEKAQALCGEIARDAPDPNVLVSAEMVLSYAACGLGDYQTAGGYLKKVLNFGAVFGADGLLLMVLPIAAAALAHMGEKEHAAATLAFVHTASPAKIRWLEHSTYIFDLRAVLEKDLGKVPFDSMWVGGQQLSMPEVVQLNLDILNRVLPSENSVTS